MNLKKKISLFSALLLAVAPVGNYGQVNAWYDDITESNDDYTAVVEFNGDYIVEGDNYQPVYSLSDYYRKNEAKNVILPSKVKDTVINQVSCCDCNGIENIVIPNTVSSVCGYFDGTEELKSISFSENIRDIRLDIIDAPSLIVRGYYGTYAEKFASDNKYDFCAIGDVDSDDNVNVSDLLKMLKHLYGIEEMTERELLGADCNLDFSVNIADMVMLKNNILDPKLTSRGASMAGAVAAPKLEDEPNIPAEKSDAYNGFVSEFTSEVMSYDDGVSENVNPVYSPMSVYMALSMAAECADATTQKELLDLLNVADTDELADINNKFFRSTNFDNFDEYCKISNSVWLNNRFIFEVPLLERLAEKYYAVSFEKDFKDETVPAQISDWIYKNTSGKLNPVVKVTDEDIAHLINTITYKNQWMDEFDDPTPDIFYTADGEQVEHDFLHYKSFYSVDIGFGDNYMTYARRMYNGYNMNFVLPDEGVTVEELLEDDNLSAIVNDKAEHAQRKIIFSSPVFEVNSKYELSDIVKSMGVTEAFQNNGNFENLINNEKNGIPGAKISNITHETKLLMNEEGCEAAAYTIVSIGAGSAPPPECETVEFNLNRPFIYYISDSAGTPLFLGVINNPAK